jgi:hypothetical protein
MINRIATSITWVLSPLLIPTYTTLLLLYSGFHFSMFAWPAKRFLLVVIFVSTALMPAITLIVSNIGKKMHVTYTTRTDNQIALIFVALYYYLGYYLLNKMPVYGIFKIMLLAGAILIVILIFISMWLKISPHIAAAGSSFGLMVGLSMRLGANPIQLLSAIIILSGITGTALLITKKQSLPEILIAFPLGFALFFSLFFFL